MTQPTLQVLIALHYISTLFTSYFSCVFLAVIRLWEILHPSYIIHIEYISIYAYWSQWIHTHNIHSCLEIGKKNWHLRFRSWGFTRICPAKLEKAHIYIYIVICCLVFKLIYTFKVNQTVVLRLTTFFRSTNSKFNVYPSWFLVWNRWFHTPFLKQCQCVDSCLLKVFKANAAISKDSAKTFSFLRIARTNASDLFLYSEEYIFDPL